MSQGAMMPAFRKSPLTPGLYFVATPIGSARDITLRALDILASADVIAAEDTRMTRKLMDLHGVPVAGRSVIPYHDHNGAAQRPKLLAMMAEGASVAYASDAGTPLVADPGFVLAREAIAAGLPVTSAPGPSAVLAALTLSGLPSDRFLFCGFVPNARGARDRFLQELADMPATLVMFESPKRLAASLGAMEKILGPERPAAVCRELTKRFEEARRGSLAELRAGAQTHPPKGEIVIVVDRARQQDWTPEAVENALREALDSRSVKEAAAMIAQASGLKRRELYQMALDIQKED